MTVSDKSFHGLQTIEDAVCQEWGVTIEEMKQRTRKRRICEPRQVIMWYNREYRKYSFDMASAPFDLDHATAMNACKIVKNYLETDAVFRNRVITALSKVKIK